MIPESFFWKGRTYPYGPLDSIGVVKAFERWMVQQAWSTLLDLRDALSATIYQDMVDGLRRDITAGLYRWGSKIRVQMLQSEAGQKKILSLMVQLHDPTVPESLFDEVYEDPAGAAIISQMFGISDPNRPPPASTTEAPAAIS